MEKSKKLKKILGEDLREHEVLRDYTNLRVGGVADYFYKALNVNDLIKAILAAQKLNVPYFILGEGTNVVISDYGFGGLVICNKTSNVAFLRDKAEAIVDSGVMLMSLITKCVTEDFGGIELLYGIPGTIGGAIYGNAGAYGTEIGDLVRGVTLLMPTGKIVRVNRQWMDFSYRRSKLKNLKTKLKPIILSVKLQLVHNKREDLQKKISDIQRKRKRFDRDRFFSCGSYFKNPGDSPEEKARFLIEKSGLRKMRVGGAGVSPVNPNFLINLGKAKAQDFRELAGLIKERVKEKTSYNLEEEIEYVGQWN